MAPKSAPPVRVLFLGASIIQGWTTTGSTLWEQHFAPLGALNLGIPGEISGQLLWRLENNFLRGLSPSVIVLQVGANDVRLTADQVAETLEEIVAQLRKLLPSARLILMAIFPTGPKDGPLRQKNTLTNQRLTALHDGDRVTVLDCGNIFLDEHDDIIPALMPDGLHLSTEGYARWAAALVPAVQSALR